MEGLTEEFQAIKKAFKKVLTSVRTAFSHQKTIKTKALKINTYLKTLGYLGFDTGSNQHTNYTALCNLCKFINSLYY